METILIFLVVVFFLKGFFTKSAPKNFKPENSEEMKLLKNIHRLFPEKVEATAKEFIDLEINKEKKKQAEKILKSSNPTDGYKWH